MDSQSMPAILIDAELAEIEAAYRREVRWPHGHRVNLDARLVLLGLYRLRSLAGLSDEEFRTCGVVLGCQLGAMESYEAFDRSMTAGGAAPLAFAHALPSMPLACASLCFRLPGYTLTVAGDAEVGLRALEQAALLMRAGRASRVIAGCWEAPSETARRRYRDPSRCRLLLVMAGHDAFHCGPSAHRATSCDDTGPVARLAQHLRAAYQTVFAEAGNA